MPIGLRRKAVHGNPPKEQGHWYGPFEREAFRLNTLDDYSESGGVGA